MILRNFIKLFVLPGSLNHIQVKTWKSVTMTKQVKIGTHDSMFHCDEALACFMLKLLPRYKDAVIVRSRDPNILDTCDILVDVGFEYNPSKHRYDHHMKSFTESLSTVIKKPGYDSKITLSSAGLVYCHFGHEIIKQVVPKASDNDVEMIFKQVYDTFIKEIDGIDNGVPMYNEEPAYYIVTDLASRVTFLNRAWNDENVDDNEQFLKAVKLTGEELLQHINYTANVWLPARSIVEKAIANRFEVHPSGEIVELPKGVPWTRHLETIEKEQNILPLIKYVIFNAADSYMVRCVPINYKSFIHRLFLPEAWGGLKGEALVKASGIEGAIFVHSGRFIGGTPTRDGAIMMAHKALELGKMISQ